MCGEIIQDSIIRDGFEMQVDVGGSIIDMYASCGHVEDARKVFHKMQQRIYQVKSGYAKYGPTEDALCLLVVRTDGNYGIPS